MDKKLKILWHIIIIFFIFTCAVGIINGGIEEKKGVLEVTHIKLENNSQGLLNSYSFNCKVKNLIKLNYLRMMTIYYDENNNKLSENLFAYESDKELLANQDNYFSEFVGYNPARNGIKPALVDIYFFDQDRDSNPALSLYHISLKIKDGGLYLH
ncbi:MAG: hypothetical protein LBR15_06230 [Methanobrevibacter sp.]|jgi:hypothetical protein|nr:hypothetical protein [Candidatus Methanovirga australis]